MDLDSVANSVLPSGKHKGKRLRDLTRNELSGVYGAWNNIDFLRKKPFFRALRIAVENFDAMQRCSSKQSNVIAVLESVSRMPGFSLAREGDSWIVTADAIEGWIVNNNLLIALTTAQNSRRKSQ